MLAWGLVAVWFGWVNEPACTVTSLEGLLERFCPAEHVHMHRGPVPLERSKKALWLEQKQLRPRVRVTDFALALAKQASRPALPRVAPKAAAAAMRSSAVTTPAVLAPAGSRIVPITTLFSVHLKEAVPLLPGQPAYAAFKRLLRDHYSNQATEVDPALLEAIVGAARSFESDRVEIVSGYRSPKYNLSLRKKGRQVAQTSQHCEGKAVDFRLRGVTTKELWAFIRGLNLGGVGIYPHSAFVHCDTGPIRFWKGD